MRLRQYSLINMCIWGLAVCVCVCLQLSTIWPFIYFTFHIILIYTVGNTTLNSLNSLNDNVSTFGWWVPTKLQISTKHHTVKPFNNEISKAQINWLPLNKKKSVNFLQQTKIHTFSLWVRKKINFPSIDGKL